MHIDNPARQRETAASIGSGELAEWLMLVRASNLKMIRLQLAIGRDDRRVALEAVDDLVALDRCLKEYLTEVPAAPRQLFLWKAVEADREMLDREKLMLAAEVTLRRGAAIESAESANDDWLGPSDLPEPVEEPRRRRWWLVAAVPVLGLALAGGAYVTQQPEAQAWLAAALTALQ
jgi:hypothetical protein